MRDKIKIGRITLRRTKQFTNQYECAAWYQTVECEPQTADLWLHPGYDRASYAPITFTFRGAVVGSDFSSLWGGVRIGKGKVDEDKGQFADAGTQWDSRSILDMMLAEKDYAIVLFDNVKIDAQPIQYGRESLTGPLGPRIYDGYLHSVPHTGMLCHIEVCK